MRLRVGSGWSDLEIRFTNCEVMMNRFAGDVLELLQGLVWLAVAVLLLVGVPIGGALAVLYGLELLLM